MAPTRTPRSAARVTDDRDRLSEGQLSDLPPVRLPVSARTRDGFLEWVRSGGCPPYVQPCYADGDIYLYLGPAAHEVRIPAGALTLDGFCAWVDSGTFPQRGDIFFLGTEVFIDMSPEELESHNKVKAVICRVLANLTQELDLGEFYINGAHLTHKTAGISTEPDGLLARWASFKSGRIRLMPSAGPGESYLRLEGRPDWVLEVLSDNSVTKDTKDLWRKYHRAGVPEYWLIDARGGRISFQIHLRRPRDYEVGQTRAGWHRSPLFGRWFRLTRRRNQLGLWHYTLHVKLDSQG
jgi:Uma2 family endonuclease